MPLFKHHDDQVVDPNPNVAAQQSSAGGLSQPGAVNPSSAYAANAPGVNDPNYNSGATGGHQHHLGRDAALGAGAAGLATHEHHKHENAGLTNDPNYNSSTAAGGNHHHLGRDAALGAGAVGLASHEHHKHENAGLANDPNYNNSSATGGHHLGRDAALGAGAAGVASHEHHKHHGHEHAAGLGSGAATGHTGAIQDPATLGPHGNPLYPSPHAPVADRLTGHTGTGAGGHTGAGVGAGAGGAGAGEHLHSSQVTTSSGKSPSTQAVIGKVEHAIGTVIGSQSLKAKGLAKEEEALAVKAQKQELVEAERLEGHAGLARDRAAAHAATGNVHGHAGEAVGNYGAGPTAVGELNQSGGGYQSIGGAGTARPF